MFGGRKPAWLKLRRPRLGLEAMEGRDCPANFWWVGDRGPQFNDPTGQNWIVSDTRPVAPFAARATADPGPADDLFLDGGVSNLSGYWGSNSTAVKSLHLVNGYAGTVRVAPITVETLDLQSGSIDQAASAELTVTQELVWTGGELDSSPDSPSVLHLTGGTGTVTAGDGYTLKTADRLSFEGSSVAAISTGTLLFTSARSIAVTGSSTVNMTNITATSAAAGPEPITLTAGLTGTYTADHIQADQGLKVAGGTAYIVGGGSVKFSGLVTPGVSVRVEGGALVIDNGTTLDAGADTDVSVVGGKLATRAVAKGAQNPAVIKARNLVVDQAGATPTEVTISDTAYNATGDAVHYYGTLEVHGDVYWLRGTYRPVVNPDDPANGDTWYTTQFFRVYVGGGQPVVALGPGTVPVDNTKLYTVIKADRGIIEGVVGGGGALPGFEAPAGGGQPGWEWLPGTGYPMGFNVWKVRRK